MAYQYIRTMTAHVLHPLRSKRDPAHLVVNAMVDSDQAALFVDEAVPAGRCMHLTRTTASGAMPSAKLGTTGNAKVPVWIYRDSDSYSAGYLGPNPATSTGPGWSTGMEGGILMYVGLEGFELATTEFDSEIDYVVGDYLRAPEFTVGTGDDANEARTVAGVVTSANAVFGASTIIGIVSPGFIGERFDGTGYDPFRNKVLSFFTTYRPPVAGLVNGTPTNLTAGR